MKKTRKSGESLEGMSEIAEIIETVLYTGILKNKIPLSVLLVSESGAAKSKLIQQYVGVTIEHRDDLHSLDIVDILREDKQNFLRHIIVPDLNLPLSHKPQVSKLTLATLLAPTSAESIFIFRSGQSRERVQHGPVGMISGVTPGVFNSCVRTFSRIGLIRRIVPIFYRIGQETEKKVRGKIFSEKITLRGLDKVSIKKRAFVSAEMDPEFEDAIYAKADLLTSYLNIHMMKGTKHAGVYYPADPTSAITGIAPQAYLQELIQAHAIRGCRDKINGEDLEFINTFIKFANSTNVVVI